MKGGQLECLPCEEAREVDTRVILSMSCDAVLGNVVPGWRGRIWKGWRASPGQEGESESEGEGEGQPPALIDAS